jgi:hypothetical protein
MSKKDMKITYGRKDEVDIFPIDPQCEVSAYVRNAKQSLDDLLANLKFAPEAQKHFEHTFALLESITV